MPKPSIKSTFPEPLPSYLPRMAKVSVVMLHTHDLISTNAGQFLLSMNGMQKNRRHARGRAETLVCLNC